MIDLNAATLWDVLGLGKKKPAQPTRRAVSSQKPARRPRRVRPKPPPAEPTSTGTPPLPKAMADRYRLMEREMIDRYGLRVRKWRTNMSGVAWQVTYRDGTVSRLIESPRPRGPVSAGIFLHEVGHHAIGFHRYKPRCLEEYHAWMFSLDQMQRWGLNISKGLENRVHDSLQYAIAKAARRGLKNLPAELAPYVEPRRPG